MPYQLRKNCTYPGCAVLVDRGRCAAHTEADRPSYSALYHTQRWQRERRAFLNAHPTCECERCKTEKLVLEATVVDHVIPHGGDEQLFWNQNNWQAMSKEHHDSKSGHEMNAKRQRW